MARVIMPDVRAEIPGPEGEVIQDAFRQLEDQLGDVGAIRTIGGFSVGALGTSAMTSFYQTFEDPILPGWLERHAGSPTVTYPSNGQAGGKALRVTGSKFFVEFPANIPIDSNVTYRFRVRFRHTTEATTDDYMSFGVQMVAADGTTIIDHNGGADPAEYAPYIAHRVSVKYGAVNQWYTFEGYAGGYGNAYDGASADSGAPRPWETGASYFRPVIEVFENGVGTDGVVEVDYISVQIITETPEVNDLLTSVSGRSAGTIAGTINPSGTIANGMVVADSILANAVVAGKLAVGSIDADNLIVNNTILAGSLNIVEISEIVNDLGIMVNGRLQWASGGYLDMDASGTDTVMYHPGFMLTADGDAIFSGELSAASGTFSGTITAASVIASDSFTASNPVFDGRVRVKGNQADGQFYLDYTGWELTGAAIIGGVNTWEMALYNDGAKVNMRFKRNSGVDGHWIFQEDFEVHDAFIHTGTNAGFFGATPVDRPGATEDLKAALASLGLLTAGGASPLDLEGGALTAGALTAAAGTFSGNVDVDGATTVDNFTVAGSISHSGGNIGFFGATISAQKADIGQTIDSTTGTSGSTINQVNGTFDDATLNDNFASLVTKINDLRATFRHYGLMA
jgi:hypothetical protein